ncbi:MAG: aldo/keto reductase [Candidatus Dormibacteraeota bacterium]|nr:aldo/keto reductase [Candidatus Dormibacteraeota bacterium]MBO0745197.1 aldo/keto reductase [Candidatus Dormibacteraeota bacterium]
MAQVGNDSSVTFHTGRSIPILGFGTWQLRGREAYDAVRFALETGYRHIDTATGYGNEVEVGRAIRDSGVPREEIFVTTKLPPDNAGRERGTIEASLRDLGLDQVDMWLIHWPPSGGPGVKTWRAFLELREEGKARDVGVSNYSPDQIETLIEATGEAPAMNQIRWSPAIYDGPRLEHSRRHRVVLEGYSPFRASDLEEPVIAEIAAAHGVSAPQVILRWHIDTGVVVIPKSASPERIRQNFDVFGFRLTDEEVSRLNALG